MKTAMWFIVAVALMSIGVLESASLSVEDFNRGSTSPAPTYERSLHQVLSIGLVGEAVAAKIIHKGRETVMQTGNEQFLAPSDVVIHRVKE
jgi:hypothetical protein